MDEEEDLETLGEQLYSLIYPKHKEDAGKLTGEVFCDIISMFFYMKKVVHIVTC